MNNTFISYILVSPLMLAPILQLLKWGIDLVARRGVAISADATIGCQMRLALNETRP